MLLHYVFVLLNSRFACVCVLTRRYGVVEFSVLAFVCCYTQYFVVAKLSVSVVFVVTLRVCVVKSSGFGFSCYYTPFLSW